MNRFVRAATAGILMAGAAHAGGHGGGVSGDDIANDASITNQVVTNGMGRSLQRYSPLDMLNKDNVKNLVPAWAFSLGGENSAGRKPSR